MIVLPFIEHFCHDRVHLLLASTTDIRVEKAALKLAQKWATNPYFDPEDCQELQELIDKNDTKELVERFYKELEFGTGGIRSILGMGLNRINKYNIRKATQALASVLNKSYPNQRLSVAISYDSRKFSKEFSEQVAGVLAANGIHSYIYSRLNPVPMLSYSVRYHKCHAGIMVTASHNPPQYNGYKVYWGDGAQIVAPHDQMVIDSFYKIKEFSEVKYLPLDEAESAGLIHWVGEDVENSYYKDILTKCINPLLCKEKGDQIKVVYTPIHGTGLIPCQSILEKMGFKKTFIVPEQAQPDQDFPTVASPNPENPEAMKMAVDLMKKEGAQVAFGTDPDSDRLGVALIHHGEVVYPNGNQIGILMLHYICSQYKEQNRMPDQPYFVKTIVTTPLQEKIAASFGVKGENTLTGFKWICGLIRDIEQKQPERNFIFGTEESFGYMHHTFVRDKDGVSSLALFTEMVLYYHLKGLNIIEALDLIYEEFGFSSEELLCLTYQGREGAEKISHIMELFRNEMTSHFAGEVIDEIEDYIAGTKLHLETGEISPLLLPKSNVIGLKFSSGDVLYLRPSGTEPKIKFYVMVSENKGSLIEKKKNAQRKRTRILDEIKRLTQDA